MNLILKPLYHANIYIFDNLLCCIIFACNIYIYIYIYTIYIQYIHTYIYIYIYIYTYIHISIDIYNNYIYIIYIYIIYILYYIIYYAYIVYMMIQFSKHFYIYKNTPHHNNTEEQYILNNFKSNFSSWWTMKTLTANQNPPGLKSLSIKSSRPNTAVSAYNKQCHCALVW